MRLLSSAGSYSSCSSLRLVRSALRTDELQMTLFLILVVRDCLESPRLMPAAPSVVQDAKGAAQLYRQQSDSASCCWSVLTRADREAAICAEGSSVRFNTLTCADTVHIRGGVVLGCDDDDDDNCSDWSCSGFPGSLGCLSEMGIDGMVGWEAVVCGRHARGTIGPGTCSPDRPGNMAPVLSVTSCSPWLMAAKRVILQIRS